MTTSAGSLSHDALIVRLREAARSVALRDAARAFVASLGSAPKRYRAVLAHLAYATNMPAHAFFASGGAQSYLCAICGASELADLDIAGAEEALARGDVRISSPARALVDLEGFSALAPVEPTAEDTARFDAMLEALAKLPPDARATDLAKAWGPLVPRSSSYARAALVETLGACGILETPDHPGHLTRWVGFWEYDETPALGGDGRPPAVWWRRYHGVNRRALDLVFPEPGLGRERFERAATLERPIAKGAVTIKKKGANPALELRTGDLVGIAFENRWLAGVVLGVHHEANKALPVIDFFDGSFASRPDDGALRGAKARTAGPYREAPHRRREALALEGLELFGPVMPARLERLARDHAPPPGPGADGTSFRAVAPRNLLYLLCGLLVPAPG